MADDDQDKLLHQLSTYHGASIISQLVDIGSERNQLEHAKFRSFVSELQCLQLKGTRLHRTSINAFRKDQYVALSYTWDPSEHEDKETGQYTVENWDDNCFQPSKVRKCVLDRVRLYMKHANVRFLWIDAHCIRQETCGVGNCTRHSRCAQKHDAVQAMDLVYQRSAHPVALLGWPLRTESELCLLARLLSGDFVRGDGKDNGKFRLSAPSNIHEAREALSLLCEITQDSWWKRAWTFQENYRSRKRMQLLIHHDTSLESQKLGYEVFGEIPGELCVSSVNFSRQTTRLCQMLRKKADLLPLGNTQRIYDRERIEGVLQAAGSYVLMLDESSCMTPTVITDIEERQLSEPWDRLAIVANCCQYSVRLNGDALRQQHHSLSLSILGMCLLNGEILDNSKSHTTSAAGLKTSEFLSKQMFQAFSAPKDDIQWLTFNKGCRLTDVELMAEGIATRGHVWKLGSVIDTSTFSRTLPMIYKPNGRLELTQRKRLLQLVHHLEGLGGSSRQLSETIDGYLEEDAEADPEEDYACFRDMYLHCMAAELAATIRRRQKLRLGAIWDPTGQWSPYRAVFTWPDEEGCGTCPPDFVFTSVRQGDPGSQWLDANDIDRHVTLNVELEEIPGSTIPHLRVRRWLHGLYFFEGCPRKRLIFPWSEGLRKVEP